MWPDFHPNHYIPFVVEVGKTINQKTRRNKDFLNTWMALVVVGFRA